ncbi:MAG: hypothetical protein ACE15D_05795 [Candidatus Eisenbacteria bacterium]
MKAKRLLLGLALLAPLGLGCSQDSITPICGPGETQIHGEAEAVETDSAVIGPDGGFLQVPGASLLVPPGALSKSVTLSLTQRGNGRVDLGPDGTRFLTPVTLSLKATGNPDAFTIQWYDPTAGTYVAIPSLTTSEGRASYLAHFSIYRITAIG